MNSLTKFLKQKIMKSTNRTLLVTLFLIISLSLKSQVLISLIFGDALNTPKIEFGLVGGFNRSYITNIPESTPLNNFNLGFYFHILLKEKSFISTGCLVKSNVGATGMAVYSVGDPAFDSVYYGGNLSKKISYFYVPVMYQHRFTDRFYLEAGFQLGLRNKAVDVFSRNAFEGDLSYTTDVRDQYTRLDAGPIGGFGYKFRSELKSAAIGINYYYGLLNVSKTATEIRNSSVYFYAKIPIGTGKKDVE